jgi:hypothetical protein
MTEDSDTQSARHRARAILCEVRSREAPDAATRLEWDEIAIEWHALANAAARLL